MSSCSPLRQAFTQIVLTIKNPLPRPLIIIKTSPDLIRESIEMLHRFLPEPRIFLWQLSKNRHLILIILAINVSLELGIFLQPLLKKKFSKSWPE